jgi:aspartate kinase
MKWVLMLYLIMVTDRTADKRKFFDALIRSISPERLTKSLEEYKAVIVTGSQGVDRDDNITNLGSGGADTVAVAIAAVLGSRECEIYTETGGVYTADPRIVGIRKTERDQLR